MMVVPPARWLLAWPAGTLLFDADFKGTAATTQRVALSIDAQVRLCGVEGGRACCDRGGV